MAALGRYVMGRARGCLAVGCDGGQALIEYALVISVVAMIALGGFSMAGGSLQTTLGGISGAAAGVLKPNTTATTGTTTAVTSTVAQTTTTTATTTTKKKKKSH